MGLKAMQVGDEVGDLLVAIGVRVPGHGAPALADDLFYPFVVGGGAAFQEFLAVHALEAGSIQ